jgi:hypothetical protein
MSLSSSTSYYANGYLCHCGARSVMRTAWTIENFGRRFHGCSKYKVGNIHLISIYHNFHLIFINL